MGNVQEVEHSKSYETTIGSLDNGSHDTSDDGNQPDISSLAHDSYSMNLVSQTAVEEQVVRGPVAEDEGVKPIVTCPWKVPININLDISAEPVSEQKPPDVQWAVPTIISPSISMCLPSLEEKLIEKPLKFEIPVAELADKSMEDNIEGDKVAGKIMKEAVAILPPELGFSSGKFQNESPLYSIGMLSVGTQLTELPIIKADGNNLTHLEQPDDQGLTGVNASDSQTLKPTDASATSQGESLANSSSNVLETLPHVTQPPNKVLIPISANQITKQTAKAHSLFAPTFSTLESTGGQSDTEVLINTGGSQDGKAEEITQETADTECMTKTIPIKDGQLSIPQPLPCKVEVKTQEEMQVMCFSYADALKRSFTVTQQRGAPKPQAKNKQGLIPLQKLDGHQNTTNVENKATTKATSLRNIKQNSAQVNSKNPKTSWYPTGPSTPTFKITKEQSRFQWPSPRNNSKDHFQFKGSWNMAQPRVSTPNNSIQFGNRNAGKDKVQDPGNSASSWTLVKNTSNRKLQEQDKFGDGKKEKVYQSYPIERRNRPKLASNMAPTFKLKEPVNRKDNVSVQPHDVGLQTPQSTLPKKTSSTNVLAATLEPLLHAEKRDQIRKCEPPEVQPYIPQSGIKEDAEVFAEEHGDTSDLSNPSPSVQHIKETEYPDFKDQAPDQSLVVLEKETSSEPTTRLEVVDKIVGVEKEDPVQNVAPKHQPGRWKDFYVDNICTMKCRCRHRPGKLPPNVIRWFSVSQNMLAEPVWVTTLKVASSLVTGTKLLLDHHSSQESEISSSAPNKRPE